MSFLDRFKPQPRWKHADAAVRAAAVEEIPSDEESLATLRELASGDEDVRVRRAAAGRLFRAADILALARSERDEGLRRELIERLVSSATAPDSTDGDAATALEGIDDQRQLATVAQTAALDAVRAAALARVQDVKALSSIARRAAHGSTALEAAQRIADRAELLNVAVKTDHKDAGVAALERAVESNTLDEAGELRETLDLVATRAKNKSVSKRARAMMQALDEAQAARRLALEAWQQQVAGLVARVESISPAAGGAAQELERTEGEWAALATEPAFELEPDSVARFEAAAGRVRTAIAEHERMEAERRAEDEHRAALHASRALMIQHVESIRGEDALDRIEDATRAWEALGAAEDDAAIGALRTQFESAVATARQRHQNLLDMQQTHARLSEVASEAERLSGEEALPGDAWTATTAEWAALVTRSEGLDEAVSQRYEQAVARVVQRAEEQHAAEERTLRQQLQRIEQLIERAQKRSTAEDLTLREAERLSRDLRGAIEAPAPVEKEQQAALLERLKAALAAVAPRVHDLREMDEWKRFANAAVQEELIAKTEALRARFGFDAPEGLKPDDQ